MAKSIAIDGPAGAGKSTIAKLVAKQLGFIYVDTGAMYRAMALFLIRNGIDKDDTPGIEKTCELADISITHTDGKQVVLLMGENVNDHLRTEEVGNMASASSVNAKVREKLVALQQKLASHEDVVMDGRDIGTVVLPDSRCKIYLTASSDVRARRRYDELVAKGESADLDKIRADIEERDQRDMTRANSPLKQADDAVLIDSSNMSIEEVKDAIISVAKERL
ncbi:MAG: (d)CMP kinase [Lachnospiraceae bacterium]|nr:(d)CMP kinase [Lachnospiraceae bacterium]